MLKCTRFFLYCSLLLSWSTPRLDAAWTKLFETQTNGGIAYTGNTFGLSKARGQNDLGTLGSIGAFTTYHSTKVHHYPLGTTLHWEQNASSAYLDLPEHTSVVHAELIWSGSFGFDPAITHDDNLSNSAATTNTPVTLTCMDNWSTTVAVPRYAASRQIQEAAGFYVRSADVTSFLQATGAGHYRVEGVPATVEASEDSSNCAGWTLCVVYENPYMLTHHLCVFVGAEPPGAQAAHITGFQAPSTPHRYARAFMSALGANPQVPGAAILVGSTPYLSTTGTQLAGTYNLRNHFFASQINTILRYTTDIMSGKRVSSGSGLLDTRGFFGLSNAVPTQLLSAPGGRQGYDITSIDISPQIQPSQQQLYLQGITQHNDYTLHSLAIQIQTQAPTIRSHQLANTLQVALGDYVTFTTTFENLGERDASSLVFQNTLPQGLTYVPHTLHIDGVLHPSQTLDAIALPNLEVGETTTLVFQAQVTNLVTSYTNYADLTYDTNLSTRTNPVILTGEPIPDPNGNVDFTTITSNTTLHGTSILENDGGIGIRVGGYDSVTTQGGSVIVLPDGTYTYTPIQNTSAGDVFTYFLIDIHGNRSASDPTERTFVIFDLLPRAFESFATVQANRTFHGSSVLSNDVGENLRADPIFQGTTLLGGSITLNQNGTYIYTPPSHISGLDSIHYTAIDDAGKSSPSLITIEILPPVENDQGVIMVNTSLDATTHHAPPILSYDATSEKGGLIEMHTSNGQYTYTPATDFSGFDSFTYTTQESQAPTIHRVSIQVRPESQKVYVSGSANTPIQAASVLANDSGSQLTIASYDATSIQGGIVEMARDGTFIYEPPINFFGTDTFGYTAQDSSGQTTQNRVQLTIEAPPTALSPLSYANQSLLGHSVLENTTEVAQDVVEVQTPSAQGGFVTMRADGTYLYTPPKNFSGTDTFDFSLMDTLGSPSCDTVTLTIVPHPTHDVFETLVNTTLKGANVLETDHGSDLQVLAFEPPLYGSVVGQSNGAFEYTPAKNFIGTDTFAYQAEDGQGQAFQGLATIHVIPLEPPTNCLGDLHLCRLLDQDKPFVKLSWSASSSPSVIAYQIYVNKHLRHTIKSSSLHRYTLCLRPEEIHAPIEICAVDSFGSKSSRTLVRIVP